MAPTTGETWTDAAAAWPALPLSAWRDTCATLHMWTQIVGKIRLSLSSKVNHWWHCTLYVTPRGLTTSPIPYRAGIFEIQFDFLDHQLMIDLSDGTRRRIPLAPRSVADFYEDLTETLSSVGIPAPITAKPDEVRNPIPFAEDTVHVSYDREYATRFWRILAAADTVFKEFRGRFIGKASPVHFFWGTFDLAVTLFSGRPAPPRDGADAITRESYSHEVISCGWWPGDDTFAAPAFFCYTAPAPAGLADAVIRPPAAFYSGEMGMFLLRYDDMREAASPRRALLEFCQSAYGAGATLARWDRTALER